MPNGKSHVGRALMLGLVLSLFGCAVILFTLSWRQSHVDCEFPGSEQCTFERTTNADVARLQLFGALGCSLVGAGLALVVRRM